MNKNDIVTVEITDIGVSGEGIGHVDGYTLFIKDAVIWMWMAGCSLWNSSR